jgi:hypothetical protein
VSKRIKLSELHERLKPYSDEDDEPEDVLAQFEATGKLPPDDFPEPAPKSVSATGAWAKYRKHLPLLSVVGWGVGVTGISGLMTAYAANADTLSDWFWRSTLAMETFVVVSAVTVGADMWRAKRLFTVRRCLKLGAIFFTYAAIIVPLAYLFVSTFATGELRQMVEGLVFLIIGAAIALVCIHGYRKAVTEPYSARPVALRFLWSFLLDRYRARAQKVADNRAQAQPEDQFGSGAIDLNLRPRREWHLPHIPLFGTDVREFALIMTGRCASAAVLTYLLAVRFNIVRDDLSIPAGGEGRYYAAAALMVGCVVGMFWFGRAAGGRFDGRLLGRAALQILMAPTVLIAEGWLSTEVTQCLAIWLFVAGTVKLCRLPWAFWKR